MKPKVKEVTEIENELFSRVALSSISNKVKRRRRSQSKVEDSLKRAFIARGAVQQNTLQRWSGSAEIFQDLGVDVLDDKSNESTQEIAQCSNLPRKTFRSVATTNSTGSGQYRCVAEDLVLFGRPRSEGPLGQDQFSKLSDEILLHIFKWLPKVLLSRCAFVCKRWKSLAYDESLWRRLDISKRSLKPGSLGQLVGRGVVALRMALAEVATPVFLESPIGFCKLQYLDLSMAMVPTNALVELIGVCNSLKKLSLENVEVDDDVCRCIGSNEQLEVLNMSMCSGITVEGIYSILTGCKCLESVNFAWSHLSEAALTHLVERISKSVTRLNISGCRQTITDAHVSHLVQRCSGLLELDISDGSALTGASIEIIVSNLKKLQHLHASHIYGISPVHFVLLTHLESLRRLEVFGLLNDVSLQALRQSMPYIEINKQLFSTIARPTTGNRRTRIWGLKLGE